MTASPTLLIHGRTITIDSTLIMGVVNASPDSFSDAGRYRSLSDQLALCEDLIADGADIIDVGGQSAITNQPEIDADEEIARVVPIVDWLHRTHPDVLISVDTYKPTVALAALARGASMINDISGHSNEQVVRACRDHNAGLVIMHTRARPKVRLQDPDHYADVADDVIELLTTEMERAIQLGLARESLVVDPGVDFAKTPHQSVAVLRALDHFRVLRRPVLLALSRKDFLGAIVAKSPRGRDAATLAAIAHLAASPGNIVRVHDVAATRDVLKTIDVLVGRHTIDRDYQLPDELRHEPH